MTGSPAHASRDAELPRFEEHEDDEEDDDEDDDEPGDDDDEEFDDDGEEGDEDDDDDDEPESVRPKSEPPPPQRSRVRAREDGPPRGTSGMGRPSTGPKVRVAAAQRKVVEPVVTVAAAAADPETEVAPDISQWPGTTDAAKMVGRHTSTIKLWRAQGRIRALQDASGCWRHHPDDLAESVDTPDQTDPGQVLAAGMSAIVVQGGQASERLIEMTRTTTDGLKETADVLRKELERAYKRIAELEEKLNLLRDKHAATHSEDLKHERHTLRLRQKHELELAGSKETSERISGLLTMLGPIAASVGARLFGDIIKAEHIEAVMTGHPPTVATPGAAGPSSDAPPATPPVTAAPSAAPESSLVPVTSIETRITAAMGRLCDAIRRLEQPQFAGLRAMMPAAVAEALDAVVRAENDGQVGKALAVLVQAAQNLSDLQFSMLRPIAPQDIVAILAELRAILRSES